MIARSDLQHLVPHVLQRLNALTPLPSHGTVAGQAVASVFFEELGLDVRGPINDVDVFVSVAPGISHGLDQQKYTSESTQYSQLTFIAHNTNLSVVSTSSAGLLNTTLITHCDALSTGAHSVTVSQDLVEGFDLNIVGVGINLSTQQVVCTEDFLRFLREPTLKITSLNTPAHTLVRLARKTHRGQLHGVACDYAQQRALCENFLYAIQDAKWNKHVTTAVCFGERYQKHVDTFQAHLPSYGLDTEQGNVFRFHIPPTTERANLKEFVEWVVRHTPPAVVSFLMLHHFDRLIEFSQSSMENSSWWLFAQELEAKRSDGFLLSCAHQLVTGVPLLYDIGMTENDCAVFVMRFAQREDPVAVNALIAQYTQLCGAERVVFGLDGDPNGLRAFAQDPVGAALPHIHRLGGKFFSHLGGHMSSDADVEYFCALLQRVAEDRIALTSLRGDVVGAPLVHHWKLESLLKDLAGAAREKVFFALLDTLDVNNERLQTVSVSSQAALLSIAHDAHISVAHLLPHLSEQSLAGFVWRSINSDQEIHMGNMCAALELISDETLLDLDNGLFVGLLRPEFLDAVWERTHHLLDQIDTNPVRKKLDRLLEAPHLVGVRVSDMFKNSKIALEHLMLRKAVDFTSPSLGATRRKM